MRLVMLFSQDFKLILIGIAHLQVLSFIYFMIFDLYYRAFAVVIYCAISQCFFSLDLISCSNSLRECLQKVETVSSSSTGMRTHGQPERNDDFDCTLCLKLLYEPVTTPCGHSFCRSCLLQALDRGQCQPLLIVFSLSNHIFRLRLIIVHICQGTDAHCAGQFCSLVPEHVQSGELPICHNVIQTLDNHIKALDYFLCFLL